MHTWFTSDTHFGHESIIRYCERPFASAAEMDRELARRWNSVVKPNDIVYHLGDFALGDPASYPAYRQQLNGKIILVRGNHDARMEIVMPEMCFAEVLDNTIVEVDGVQLWLNHYPLGIPDHRGRPFTRPKAPGPYDVVLCGHVHQQFKVRNGNLNVGVDVWGFAPISIVQIKAALPSFSHSARKIRGRNSSRFINP